VGTDVRAGPGVDAVLDIHETNIPTGCIGTALVMDTLEHVKFPHRVLEEMHRVLMPGGLVVISSHMNWPIHSFPNDYWRFTPQGFAVLLRLFSQILVESAGTSFPLTQSLGWASKTQACRSMRCSVISVPGNAGTRPRAGRGL
jgi:SAM-dependent methyltransferase